MADKFWTTNNKRWIATAGLVVAGWHIIGSSGVLKIPAMLAIISNPLLFGFSLLTLAGFIAWFAIFLIWTEY
jgi:hypothetical protein